MARRPSVASTLSSALSSTLLVALAAVSSGAAPLSAQAARPPAAPAPLSGEAASGPLFDELARMDSLLFDASFVSCDARVANAIFADDIEFYHDKGGVMSGEQVRENTRNRTKDCPGRRGLVRVLVPASLRVYPIRDYGAVQMGEHRFVERGAAASTDARFVHLWHRTNGAWRLTRVLSFDHQAAPAAAR